MDTRPLIIPVHKNAAVSFTQEYCEKYGVEWHGDPNYGHNVYWYGAVCRGDLRAVIGFVDVPEGIMIWGFYGDKSIHSPRTLLALTKLAYSLSTTLYAYVHKDNVKMLSHCFREGWNKYGESASKNEWLLRRNP